MTLSEATFMGIDEVVKMKKYQLSVRICFLLFSNFMLTFEKGQLRDKTKEANRFPGMHEFFLQEAKKSRRLGT